MVEQNFSANQPKRCQRWDAGNSSEYESNSLEQLQAILFSYSTMYVFVINPLLRGMKEARMDREREKFIKTNSLLRGRIQGSRESIPPPRREFFHEMTEFPSGGDSTRVGRAEKRRGKENKRDGGHKVAVHRPREEFPSRGDENSWNSFGELAPPPAHAWRHQSEIDSNIFRWGGGEGGEQGPFPNIPPRNLSFLVSFSFRSKPRSRVKKKLSRTFVENST